jgi:putative motility protein YjfB-like
MDVAGLAATLLSARSQAMTTDVRMSVLKKAIDTQGAAASALVEKSSLPLATSGRVGTLVNTYA